MKEHKKLLSVLEVLICELDIGNQYIKEPINLLCSKLDLSPKDIREIIRYLALRDTIKVFGGSEITAICLTYNIIDLVFETRLKVDDNERKSKTEAIRYWVAISITALLSIASIIVSVLKP